MTTSRVEVFNELVGHLFAEMHDNFPFAATFDVADIAKKMNAEPGQLLNSEDPDWGGAHFPTGDTVRSFMKATLTWLDREGFIRRQQGDALAGSLTTKAFAALNTTPAGLAPKTTLGQSLAAAATEGGKEFSRATVAELARTAIASATMLMASHTLGS